MRGAFLLGGFFFAESAVSLFAFRVRAVHAHTAEICFGISAVCVEFFYFLEASASAIFMALTFKGSPKRVMKPLASW